jgi:hypothetical protein
MKIDTQGMSFGDSKGGGRSLQEQRDAIPPLQVREMNLISDALRVELKQLINEVLDDREHLKKLEGPYDFPEDDSDEWLYRGTY